jgi:hypothetical protein
MTPVDYEREYKDILKFLWRNKCQRITGIILKKEMWREHTGTIGCAWPPFPRSLLFAELLFVLLLWAMARETKSLRPLCSKQEFYYASRLRGDNFSKPRAPISVRRWVIYPPGGLCNQGVLQCMVHRWSERQVGYRETSWLQSLSPAPL